MKRVQDFGPHQDFAAYSQVVSEPSECERERKAEKSGRSWLRESQTAAHRGANDVFEVEQARPGDQM